MHSRRGIENGNTLFAGRSVNSVMSQGMLAGKNAATTSKSMVEGLKRKPLGVVTNRQSTTTNNPSKDAGSQNMKIDKPLKMVVKAGSSSSSISTRGNENSLAQSSSSCSRLCVNDAKLGSSIDQFVKNETASCTNFLDDDIETMHRIPEQDDDFDDLWSVKCQPATYANDFLNWLPYKHVGRPLSENISIVEDIDELEDASKEQRTELQIDELAPEPPSLPQLDDLLESGMEFFID